MDPVETGLTASISKCHDIATLAGRIACSVEDLIDHRRDGSALVDLKKRLQEFAFTLQQLKRNLEERHSFSPRLNCSIGTSLDDFGNSLAQLQERVINAMASEKGSKDDQRQTSVQLWSPDDIRLQGQGLGIMFQSATLLIETLERNEVEEGGGELEGQTEGIDKSIPPRTTAGVAAFRPRLRLQWPMNPGSASGQPSQPPG